MCCHEAEQTEGMCLARISLNCERVTLLKRDEALNSEESTRPS